MTEGKKLLVLGGTYASYDVVKNAREMGVHTIVADYYEHGMAKEIADETVLISTTDIEGLSKFIRAKGIDGVFCGPSEFNIRNMIRLTEATGLPCYTPMKIWDRCARKDSFKAYCRQYGVDTPEEYHIDPGMPEEELEKIDYPIIVKPVDGSSSVGVSVCMSKEDVASAYDKAKKASMTGKIVAEKYISNEGKLFGARYLVHNGTAVPYLLIDTYIVDPVGRKSLISAFTVTPSKYSDYYLSEMDAKVRNMIRGLGIENGSVFFQALPYRGKIYFHEMGYRLSGGMIYKLTEPLMGINDMKMMIRNALGGNCLTPDEAEKIDLTCQGRCGAQLMIPLKAGTIGGIEGLEEAAALPCVTDFLQYYYPGDTIREKHIGTLQQHFGRFTIIADNEDGIEECVEKIQKLLFIYDAEGHIMNYKAFDCGRIRK